MDSSFNSPELQNLLEVCSSLSIDFCLFFILIIDFGPLQIVLMTLKLCFRLLYLVRS